MLHTLLTIKYRRTERCEVFIVSEKRDYYEVLGVSKDADDAALMRTSRRRSRRWHASIILT